MRRDAQPIIARRMRSMAMPHHDAATALTLIAMFGITTAAVTSHATQPLDDAIRRRQPHPRRGRARVVAKGIKHALRPEEQLALGAAVTLSLHQCNVPRAHRVMTAVSITVLADRSIKLLLERRRPPGYRGTKVYESFPSGHTAATTAIAVTTSHLLQRAGHASATHAALFTVAAIAVVAESRLLLDEHWPSDVLAGALLGSAIAHAVVAQ